MKKIKLLIAALALVIGIGALTFVPTSVVSAVDPSHPACQGLEITGGGGCNGTGDSTIQETIKTIINVLSLVVGVIAVIMIIVGGLKYITSGGDSSSVTSAKNTILYAVVGLVVVVLAQAIVRFVLDKVG